MIRGLDDAGHEQRIRYAQLVQAGLEVPAPPELLAHAAQQADRRPEQQIDDEVRGNLTGSLPARRPPRDSKQRGRDAVPTKRGRPNHVIAGFNTAYFKNLGSSKGVSNLSFIGLPEWVEVEDNTDRTLWIEVLKEHRSILSRLDESRSEQHNLLEYYRDFLSGNALEQFLEFLVDYGAFALSQAERSKPIQWFTTTLLGRVLMGMDDKDTGKLSLILENTGFQNIAGAIRRSTRGALYSKKLSNDKTYEVRYGLAQELKRKAMYKEEFATALAGFISEYMTENLRAADRDKRGRPSVTTTDLEQVIGLMDSHNPETVAMLLIAYGYSKEPKDPDEVKTDDADIAPELDPEGDDNQ